MLIKPVIHLILGPAYEITGDLIIILSPLLLFKAISFFCATILVAIGAQSKRVIPQVFSLLINIGLNLLLIPRIGVIAPAFVYVISEGVLMVGYLFVGVRSYDSFQKRKSIS